MLAMLYFYDIEKEMLTYDYANLSMQVENDIFFGPA